MSPSSALGNNHEDPPITDSVALLVVTYNSARVLPPLLGSIESSSHDGISESVFVDNASTDATVELVKHSLTSALVITNPKNFGFAAAVNQGVKATSSELVLLANPDAQWSHGTVSRLRQFLGDHPRAAAVCPRLVFPDGSSQSSIRRFPTHANIWLSRQSPLRFLRHLLPSRIAYTIPDPIGPSPVEAVAATFMLFRRAAFNAVGGMNEGYFLYVEDTDLCRRWHAAGYEVWIDPSVAVIHDWQGGSGECRALRRHHRNGMQRYFRTHHAGKPIRNSILGAFLGFANMWDRIRSRDSGDARA